MLLISLTNKGYIRKSYETEGGPKLKICVRQALLPTNKWCEWLGGNSSCFRCVSFQRLEPP